MAKLINLAQIKGGVALQSAIDAVQKAYPATNVTTNVVKTAAVTDAGGQVTTPAVNYTAEELLETLKTSLDTLTGGAGSGSLSDQINTAVKPINEGLVALQNKKFYDNVRLFVKDYSATSANLINVSQTDYNALTMDNYKMGVVKGGALVANITDFLDFQTGTYNVYDFDNTPIMTKDKKNVTMTLTVSPAPDGKSATATAVFNGVPATFKETVTPTVVTDEAVTVGADNVTLTLAHGMISDKTVSIKDSADKAVDSKAFDVNYLKGIITFASAQTASAAFKVSYTYKAYAEVATEQSAVTADTTKGGVMWKVFPVKAKTLGTIDEYYLLDNNELNLISMESAITEISNNLTKESDIVAEIIAKVGQTNLTNACNTITSALEARIAALETKVNRLMKTVVDTFNPTDKQTSFELTSVPVEASVKPIDFYVNGLKYFEGTNSYVTVDRTTIGTDGNKGYKPTVTWNFTSDKQGFDLGTDYEITVEYLADETKTKYSAQA